MSYTDVLGILKEFGRKTKCVWLTSGSCNNMKCIMLKYDNTRRYYMSQILTRKDFRKKAPLQRVSEDTFKSNVEYLLQHGYSICF